MKIPKTGNFYPQGKMGLKTGKGDNFDKLKKKKRKEKKNRNLPKGGRFSSLVLKECYYHLNLSMFN